MNANSFIKKNIINNNTQSNINKYNLNQLKTAI